MDKDPGKIITFYSYKGGTGRSMILANVGYLLATHPAYRARVLMIDWDLEAPGLHRYFEDKQERPSGTPLMAAREKSRDREPGLSGSPFLSSGAKSNDRERVPSGSSLVGGGEKNKARRSGLIDYFETISKIYHEMAPAGALPESSAHTDEAAAIYDKVRRQGLYEVHTHAVKDIPNLHLMRAGDSGGPDYPQQVRSFQWDNFYLNYGSFFTHFRDHLMDLYDYILIDSRTGVTDTSGICTRIMPEKLVTVFAPNLQNIDGIIDVIRRSMAHRSASRDPRSLQFFPLASRIDPAASNLRTLWWKGGLLNGEDFAGYEKIFEALFTELFELDGCSLHEYFDATQVPHDSDYAYGEQIAARSRTGIYDRLSIGKACANLTERLVKLKTPWEALPELKTELEEARRHAAEATQKAQELEKKGALTSRFVSGLLVVASLGSAGGLAGLVPSVLSDSRFEQIGWILAALIALPASGLLGYWSEGIFKKFAKRIYYWTIGYGWRGWLAAVSLGMVVGVALGGLTLLWWNSDKSPSKPASRVADELSVLLYGTEDASAQIGPDQTISIQVSPQVQSLAASLAGAEPKYQNLLLLKSNSGSVPLLTFFQANLLLGHGSVVSSQSELEAQFANGVGEFRFGMKLEEVYSLLELHRNNQGWEFLPVAGEYHDVQVRYLSMPLSQLPVPPTSTSKTGMINLPNMSAKASPAQSNTALSNSRNANPIGKAGNQTGGVSLYSALPAFHPCWSGNDSVTFFFTQSGGLIRISVRLFADACKDKLSLLENFAKQYDIVPFRKETPVPCQVTLPQTTVAATNGPSISSLEVFLNQLPTPQQNPPANVPQYNAPPK